VARGGPSSWAKEILAEEILAKEILGEFSFSRMTFIN
jgi:hypothetical protein